MLALQEFGITEVSSNYSLYEVTVENGAVRQKLQPDDQTNLAERIGISSRYYIKNRMSSDQLITDDVESDLSKVRNRTIVEEHEKLTIQIRIDGDLSRSLLKMT